MNKSEMKTVMEQIEGKLQGQKSVSYMAHQNKSQWKVLEELWGDGHKRYNFNGVHYNIEYNSSHITHGNRSTTSDFTVSRYSKKEHFDADEVLAKKEITVCDWMGGVERVEECKLTNNPMTINDDLADVASVVQIIMMHTNYDIMIQRHDTGDVTVWIDNGKFKQR